MEINPVPVVKKGDAFEDTMMLIDMMKQQAEKENKMKKVGGVCVNYCDTNKDVQEDKIRKMAMEQKRKMEKKGNSPRSFI